MRLIFNENLRIQNDCDNNPLIVEGKQIVEYKQVVFGEVIAGANFMRDFFAGITDGDWWAF